MISKHSLVVIFFLISATSFAQNDRISVGQSDSLSVKELFFAGLRDKLIGNDNAAKENFTKVLFLDNANDAALYELANANLKLNNLIEAANYANAAANIKPDNKYYLQLLAEIYKAGNHLALLNPVLDKLIKLDPDNRAYYFDKAKVQQLTNKIEEARATYKTIEQKFGSSNELSNAKSRLAQSTGNNNNSEKLLENNNRTSADYLNAAVEMMRNGKYAEALISLKKAAVLTPNNYQIQLALADVYRNLENTELSVAALKLAFSNKEMPLEEKMQIMAGMFSKIGDKVKVENAFALAETLIKQNPNNAMVLGLYADVLFKQGNFAAALPQYENALKINDQVFAFWEGLINTHNLLGQYAMATKVCNDALSIYPNQASLYYFLAYAEFRSSKPEEAKKNLERAVALASEEHSLLAQCFLLKADISIDENKFDEAKAAFNLAIAQEPDNYQILTKAAYFLALRDEDLDKAEKYAATATKSQPNNAATTDTYAFVLFKQKKYASAKRWIEVTLKNKESNNGVYLEHYGDILYFLGDKEAAVEQWQKAKEAGNISKKLSKKINEKKYIK